jgi:hypothetical protein
MKNLSDILSSKQTAKNRFTSLVSPITIGFFRDEFWHGPNQVFRAIVALGGQVEINESKYFAVNGVENMGKRWILSVTANGYSFPAILTASFSDKPNGEVYDLTVTT